MKKTEIAVVGAFVALVVGMVTLFVMYGLPKRLDPPRRWVSEATATGIVSRVSQKGIDIRFPDGKTRFFRDIGFTNGQAVRVEVRVHYVSYYDGPTQPLAELVFRSVYPNP